MRRGALHTNFVSLLRVHSRWAVWIIIGILACFKSYSQMYVAPGASLSVFGKDTLSISTSMVHRGVINTISGSVINFMGLTWTNDTTASFTESAGDGGGKFRFMNAGAATGNLQMIYGGYNTTTQNGPGFPNLSVENSQGLFLSGTTDLQVKNTLDLNSSNYLWLNNSNFQSGISGATAPFNGVINNYTENGYIVTGQGVTGGFVYRTNVGTTATVFPVGADGTTITYLPSSITYQGIPQRFFVRVFNQILTQAVAGGTETASYVKATWNLGKDLNDTAQIIVQLQHNKALEGTEYTLVRTDNPVGILPGYLTTGTIDPNTYINTAYVNTPVDTSTYLSKSVDTAANAPTVNLFDTVTQKWQPVSVIINPKVALAKAAISATLTIDGAYDVLYKIVVKNTGNTGLTNLSVYDNLAAVFPSPMTFSISSLQSSKGLLTVNSNYNGTSDTALVSKDSLHIGLNDTIILGVHVIPEHTYGTFYNLASAVADSISGISVIRASSINGLIPDTTNLVEVPVKTPITLKEVDVKIPGGFSPNGDGINDKFVIEYAGSYYVNLEVFNRWGTLVYKKLNYANDWDGTSNQPGVFLNNKLTEGTYYTFVTLIDKVTGERINITGSLTLRRQ